MKKSWCLWLSQDCKKQSFNSDLAYLPAYLHSARALTCFKGVALKGGLKGECGVFSVAYFQPSIQRSLASFPNIAYPSTVSTYMCVNVYL